MMYADIAGRLTPVAVLEAGVYGQRARSDEGQGNARADLQDVDLVARRSNTGPVAVSPMVLTALNP
jgi:hypothetical protein